MPFYQFLLLSRPSLLTNSSSITRLGMLYPHPPLPVSTYAPSFTKSISVLLRLPNYNQCPGRRRIMPRPSPSINLTPLEILRFINVHRQPLTVTLQSAK